MIRYHERRSRSSSPRTSQRVELPRSNIQQLQLTQFSPIAMIQRVIRLRKRCTGTTTFRIANTMSGVNQTIVFAVLAASVMMPRRFLVIFLSGPAPSISQSGAF